MRRHGYYGGRETTGPAMHMSRSSLRFAYAALTAAAVVLVASPSGAACLRNVALDQPRLIPAAAGFGTVPPGQVGVTYIGHASFLIETAAGVKAVTDYNDYVRADIVPDIVTMNNAHSTHYSIAVQPDVRHVLQGWGGDGGPAEHDLSYRDLQVRNIPTNVRNYDSTRYNGNSIFVFETAELCIAHLGHLHHRLTKDHLAALGQIDVLMVPVDGSYTLNIEGMIEVIEQIRAPVVIPMHFFSRPGLDRFLAALKDKGTAMNYTIEYSPTAGVLFSRASLPQRPQLLVLPGH